MALTHLSECSENTVLLFVYGVLSALYCETLTPDVDTSLEPERMVSVPHACLVVVSGLLPREGGIFGT